MFEAIQNFATQFAFEPVVENAAKLPETDKFIVCGMGGSHLAAGLLKTANPELDLVIHRDYGLPRVPEYFLRDSLLIMSSYSGNTEEVIDTFKAAVDARLNVAALTTGGTLMRLAKERGAPYIEIPATGIQPRMALGYALRGLLKLMRLEAALAETAELAHVLDPSSLEQEGRELAQTLKNRAPVIYASTVNFPIAYNWKIKFNETGKIPAFYNVLPELNHNEMTGFDVQESSKHLSERFHFILLKDLADHPRILRRMEILDELYRERGLPVTMLELHGNSIWEKIFSSLTLADWTAYYTAELYGLEPEQVPMIEELKRVLGAKY